MIQLNIKQSFCHVYTPTANHVYSMQYAGKRPKFDCPKCRNEIVVPGESVDNLPSNFIVENLMIYQDSFNVSIFCGSCEKDENQAVSFCHHCECFLCRHCVENHEQMRALQHHKIFTVDELQKEKYNPSVQKHVYCEKHPKNELTMYCSEVNCKVPICSTCSLIDHRGHTMVELTTAIEEIVMAVQQSCAKLAARNEELARKRAEVETLKDSLTDNFNQRKKDVQESEASLSNLMHVQCSKAHSHIQNIYQNKMENMTKKVKSIDDLSTQITTACEFANDACDMSHPTQLLTSEKQIMNRLQELNNAKLPETKTLTSDITFSVLHHLLMILIRYLLLHLWKVSPGVEVSSFMDKHRRKVFYAIIASLLLLLCSYAHPSEFCTKADPQQSTIHLDRSTHQLGIYTIQTADCNGHLLTTGSAKVVAYQLWSNLLVQDNKDGTYSFSYSSLFGDFVYVEINGEPMKGSPFYVPREIDPQRCTIELHSEERQVAKKRNVGPRYKAIVHAVDLHGQKMTIGGARVKATQLQFDLQVLDNKDGTYEFQYYPRFGEIHETVDGKPMRESPFTVRPKVTLKWYGVGETPEC